MRTPLGPSQCPDWRGVLNSGVASYTQDMFWTGSNVHVTIDICISGVSARWGFTIYHVEVRNDECGKLMRNDAG